MLEQNKHKNEETLKIWLFIFDCVGGSSIVFGSGVFVDSEELARLSDRQDVKTRKEQT